jgi:hypothetical protein
MFIFNVFFLQVMQVLVYKKDHINYKMGLKAPSFCGLSLPPNLEVLHILVLKMAPIHTYFNIASFDISFLVFLAGPLKIISHKLSNGTPTMLPYILLHFFPSFHLLLLIYLSCKCGM